MTVLQPAPCAPPAPRLLDQVRDRARQRGHSDPDAVTIVGWCERFIRFHGKRHRRELGVVEVRQVQEALARTEKDPVRALAAGREALAFLYQDVLQVELGELRFIREASILLKGA